MNTKRLTFTILLVLLATTSIVAQQKTSIPCGDDFTGADLPVIPVIESSGGILSGTLYTVSEQVKMGVGGPGSVPTCYPQWVRAYRKDAPANWNPPASQLLRMMPGPTLRARIGELVELTFLNSIDSGKFPQADQGCDKTSAYPGQTGDSYPDCFAGSIFTNVHYHGTHTNPNTTGDNVFLQIRPSPRTTDGKNTPIVTADSVKDTFKTFFDQCTAELKPVVGPKEWPTEWQQLPQSWWDSQQELLTKYAPAWAAQNDKLMKKGQFPQYYIGAFPYCFKLPDYTATQTANNTISTAVHAAHTHGAGRAETNEAEETTRPLVMGQSPGTHWYHAHKHGSTTVNVMNGMTGVFVIEGPYDDAINAYYGKDWTRTQPIMVIQQLSVGPSLLTGGGGGPGPDFSVNGRLRPVVKMPGNSVQMWRIANTSSRAGVYFDTPTALTWKQLAQDGVQFKDLNYQATRNVNLLLASGNRADLLVKAPAYNAAKGANNSYPVYVYNTVDPSDRPPQKPLATRITLFTVEVTPDGAAMDFMPKAPDFPEFLKDITDKEVKGTKILEFASTPVPPGPPPASTQTIDGKKFDGELGAVVELNQTEEWKIVNATYGPSSANQISHPFHIHINPFQISELFEPNKILYSTAGPGKVTTTKGSSTIAGDAQTTFTRDFVPGDYIWIPGEGPAQVQSIASDSSLTIDITAKTAATSTYTIAIPLYTVNSAAARPGQCVLNANDEKTWKPCRPTEPPVDRIWWDVFPIPSGGTFINADGTRQLIPGYFKMRSRFVDYSGYFVLHCHILAHEDRGMMTVVGVTPIQTPYSHH